MGGWEGEEESHEEGHGRGGEWEWGVQGVQESGEKWWLLAELAGRRGVGWGGGRGKCEEEG